MNTLVKVLGLRTVLFASALSAEETGDSTNITFGIYTTDSPSSLTRQFTPILNSMEKKMESYLGRNVTIDIKITKTYVDAIGLLADGTFDFVRFGPVSYIRAKELDDGVRIAALERIGGGEDGSDGAKVFYGILATHNRSNITTVEDVRGSNFGFGNQHSTIGRYLAQKFLVDNGIYESDLEVYEYLPRHDAVGFAINDGRVDAGALKENTFDSLVRDGIPLREVARFPNVTKPWLVSSLIPDDVFNAMNIALLSITDRKVLAQGKIDGFIDGEDSDYDIIRSAIKDNHLFFTDK